LQDCDSSTDGSPTSSDSKGAAGGAKGQAKLSQRFKGSLNSPADLLAFKVEVVTSTAMSIKGKALYTSLKTKQLAYDHLGLGRSVAVPHTTSANRNLQKC
jgi:hypothetical protein